MNTELIDIYNGRDIKKKVYTSLLGVCQGLIADNDLNEREFDYLRQWLLENDQYLSTWPANIIMKQVNEILADGVVTQDELNHMRDVLAGLIGGTIEETGSVSGNSTSLPLNHDAIVHFQDRHFCFTGKMVYAPRQKCAEVTQEKGGIVLDNVRKDLSYLVIGLISSDSWVNTSYGRKIEKAVEFQGKGHPLYIISEQMWLASLEAASA